MYSRTFSDVQKKVLDSQKPTPETIVRLFSRKHTKTLHSSLDQKTGGRRESKEKVNNTIRVKAGQFLCSERYVYMER